MILFLDASAIVSMLLQEDDALTLADRLDEASELIWSPMSVWETVAALAREREYNVSIAHGEVYEFGREWQVRLVPIGADESDLAIEAYRLFGRGSGHATTSADHPGRVRPRAAWPCP